MILFVHEVKGLFFIDKSLSGLVPLIVFGVVLLSGLSVLFTRGFRIIWGRRMRGRNHADDWDQLTMSTFNLLSSKRRRKFKVIYRLAIKLNE
jgi:hypothetical protein